MDSEDFIEPPTVSYPGYVSEGDGPLPLNSEEKNEINWEASQVMLDDTCEEAVETKCVPVTDSFNENKNVRTYIEKDVINKTPTDPVDFEMTESVAVVNTLTSNCSVNTDNGSVAVESEGILSNHKKTETHPYIQGSHSGSISGVKRPRMTVDDLQPSVHVIYNSLTRESKKKLEELLQQWSQWHGQNCSSSNSNFATLDEESGVVISRRADRHFEEEGPVLSAALDGMKLNLFPEYEVRVRYATEHRCGVVVKGPKLSGNITGTDPLKDNRLLLQAEPLDDSDEAKHTAAVVNELSKEISRILVAHPINAKRAAERKNVANLVLLRGCGIRIEVPKFEQIHGLKPCMVAPTKIIAGLGLSLGLDILEAPGATGDYRTLLTSKATAITKALSAPLQSCPNVFVPGEDEHKTGPSDGFDFGFLHIKAIDDAGHDKASIFKAKGLEAVDKAIRQLAALLWVAESSGSFQYYICVTGDHSTPVEYGDHSFEPVPFAICRLKDFIGALGGESHLLETSLDPFPLPTVEKDSEEYCSGEAKQGKRIRAFRGDSVCEFNEIAAARGCLGRFSGGEMMGIIKAFVKI